MIIYFCWSLAKEFGLTSKLPTGLGLTILPCSLNQVVLVLKEIRLKYTYVVGLELKTKDIKSVNEFTYQSRFLQALERLACWNLQVAFHLVQVELLLGWGIIPRNNIILQQGPFNKHSLFLYTISWIHQGLSLPLFKLVFIFKASRNFRALMTPWSLPPETINID